MAATIYIFSSSAREGLFAFAGDRKGTRLPERHGPWRQTGSLRPDQRAPHRFDRGVIEQAIVDEGFQLWRMKKKPD